MEIKTPTEAERTLLLQLLEAVNGREEYEYFRAELRRVEAALDASPTTAHGLPHRGADHA